MPSGQIVARNYACHVLLLLLVPLYQRLVDLVPHHAHLVASGTGCAGTLGIPEGQRLHHHGDICTVDKSDALSDLDAPPVVPTMCAQEQMIHSFRTGVEGEDSWAQIPGAMVVSFVDVVLVDAMSEALL